MNKIWGVVLFAAIVAGCGGGGSGGAAPVINSITDGAGNAVAVSGTTGVFPTQFTVTFDQAMDDASVTTAGNITAVCGGLTANLTVTAGGTAGVYLVVPENAWKAALLECTVTFSPNIKSVGGTPLASAATYTFTNACAVSDDFNAQSISDEAGSCWTISPDSTYTTWVAMSGILSFDTAESTLDAVFLDDPNNVIMLTKAATLDSEFTAEINITSFQNMTDGDMALIAFGDGVGPGFNNIILGKQNDNGSTRCIAMVFSGGESGGYIADCAEDIGYVIRFTVSGSTLNIPEYRKESETDFTPMTLWGTIPAINFGTDPVTLWLVLFTGDDVGGGNLLVSIDSIYIDGATVTGQY